MVTLLAIPTTQRVRPICRWSAALVASVRARHPGTAPLSTCMRYSRLDLDTTMAEGPGSIVVPRPFAVVWTHRQSLSPTFNCAFRGTAAGHSGGEYVSMIFTHELD